MKTPAACFFSLLLTLFSWAQAKHTFSTGQDDFLGLQPGSYCPASRLKKGINEVIVLDLHQKQAATINGRSSPQ